MKQLFLYTIAALSLMSSAAWATLGGDEKSVTQDQEMLKAQPLDLPTQKNLCEGCRVVAMQAHGYKVKEFINAGNEVFAISWRGLSHPDLKILLGKYHADIHSAEAKIHKGRRYVRHPVKSSYVTLIRGGHQGDIRGRAILNAKVPPGFKEVDYL